MFSFLVRGIGFVVLALALVAAVLDLTRSIATSKVLITSFNALWQAFAPGSLAAVQQAAQGFVHPALWDPMITSFIALPSWLVLWLLSMALLWMGQRRDNPYGRFASD